MKDQNISIQRKIDCEGQSRHMIIPYCNLPEVHTHTPKGLTSHSHEAKKYVHLGFKFNTKTML